MMRRRLIPVAAALVILASSLIPVSLGWIDESTAIRWTLALVALSFGVKAVVFGAMRRRLGISDESTVFGIALADLVAGLAVLDIVLSYVFSAAYFYAQGVNLTACRRRQDGTIDSAACLASLQAAAMPQWMTIANRSAIATLATLAIGTGVAVLWEMSRSRTGLAVRVPPTQDQVIYDGPERRQSERRGGWVPPAKGDPR